MPSATKSSAPEQLLTPEEVAELLRFTRRKVYDLMREGAFGEIVPLSRKAKRITRTGYDAYLESRKASP